EPRPGPSENGKTGQRNRGLHVGARGPAEECELALWTRSREREEGRRKGGAGGYRGGKGHRPGYRGRLQALWRQLSHATIIQQRSLSPSLSQGAGSGSNEDALERGGESTETGGGHDGNSYRDRGDLGSGRCAHHLGAAAARTCGAHLLAVSEHPRGRQRAAVRPHGADRRSLRCLLGGIAADLWAASNDQPIDCHARQSILERK